MLPDPHNNPSVVSQTAVGVPVSRHVGGDLLSPPLCVCFGSRTVNRAPVPEAAVHEDGDAKARKGDVGASSHSRESIVDSKSIAGPV